MRSAGGLLLAACALAGVGVPGRVSAQAPVEAREVRQLVTFRFLPGQTGAALELYRTLLVPIYREIEPMRTVRLLSEVESPEPLDLMVVTHYADMAGMDRANRALRQLSADRPPIGELYRRVSDLSSGPPRSVRRGDLAAEHRGQPRRAARGARVRQRSRRHCRFLRTPDARRRASVGAGTADARPHRAVRDGALPGGRQLGLPAHLRRAGPRRVAGVCHRPQAASRGPRGQPGGRATQDDDSARDVEICECADPDLTTRRAAETSPCTSSSAVFPPTSSR